MLNHKYMIQTKFKLTSTVVIDTQFVKFLRFQDINYLRQLNIVHCNYAIQPMDCRSFFIIKICSCLCIYLFDCLIVRLSSCQLAVLIILGYVTNWIFWLN